MKRPVLHSSFCFLLLVGPPAWAEPSARCAVAVDLASKRPHYEKNAAVSHPPASTAKLVTALVVLERLKPSATVRVSERAVGQPPSKAGLRAGESWRVEDLLYALLLASGNDVACALAEAVSGSEAAFAERMTAKARLLGARDTRFGNASGLPHPANRTSASDMARIAAAACRNQTLRKILGTREATIRSTAGRRLSLRNHNRLLWDDAVDLVGKTGYTRASQKCFAGVLRTAGREWAVTVLGSRDLWGDLRALAETVEGGGGGGEGGGGEDLPDPLAHRDRIRRAQEALATAGFDPGPIDGIIGPRTREALRRFQAARNLVESGALDPATAALLGVRLSGRTKPLARPRRAGTIPRSV